LNVRTVATAHAVFILCAISVSARAHAAEWDLSLDVRGIDSNGRRSFLELGQGKLRFDEQHEGVRLGRFRASWTQPFHEVFAVHLDASAWDNDDKSFVDLTEAYLDYRPQLRAGFGSRVRLGAFFPPVSLENRASGWESPYTLTPSAISTWIGEEIRAIGLEGQINWGGSDDQHPFGLQLTGAVFGWNDPAGSQIAAHGFAFHDRQTTLFGRIGEPVAVTAPKKEPFHEIDGRPGFYVGGQARYADYLVLNLFHYDNRADPSAFAPSVRGFAWETRFDVAALSVATETGWSALAQYLTGDTYIAPRGMRREWEFHSYSALLAKTWGPHLLCVRYDGFEVELEPAGAPGNEQGHAWAVAYSLEHGQYWRFTLEWLRVRSDVASRPARVGEPALARETQIELGVRYALSGSF
jgi:hypothetical protein